MQIMTGKNSLAVPTVKTPNGTGGPCTLAAADKLHDFEVVIVPQQRSGPLGPPDDLAIQFHCHAVALNLHLPQQIRDGETCGYLLVLTIDNDIHRETVPFDMVMTTR